MDLHRRRPTPSASILRAALGTALVLALFTVALVGCGATAPGGSGSKTRAALALGRPVHSRGDGAGVGLARRFARGYARCAYRRRPVVLPQEASAVRSALTVAARHVPTVRRRLRPKLLELAVSLRLDGGIDATARIGDGHFPSFSVAFTVSRRSGRWLVTSVSLPD